MTGECMGVIKPDLWMPHTIKFFDDGLVVLDSLRGTLLKNNFSVSGTFPGFLRGLITMVSFSLLDKVKIELHQKN